MRLFHRIRTLGAPACTISLWAAYEVSISDKDADNDSYLAVRKARIYYLLRRRVTVTSCRADGCCFLLPTQGVQSIHLYVVTSPNGRSAPVSEDTDLSTGCDCIARHACEGRLAPYLGERCFHSRGETMIYGKYEPSRREMKGGSAAEDYETSWIHTMWRTE